jgi:sigma-B regulation protein RsbU (phosphoserine phosphatase)
MADLEDTLLLIEANGTTSRQLTEHFNSAGYHVVTAKSVDEYLSGKQPDEPQLAIADCCPDDVTRLLAHFGDSNTAPPIIANSSIQTAECLLTYLRSGAADIVPLPLEDFSILDKAVERQMEKVRLYRENRQYRLELETVNKELRAGLAELRADQRAGRHVQMKMLPERGADINGIHFDYCIKPSLYLSGDFFEYFRLDENKVAFYFADVAGHGASSAFVTVLLKNLSNRLKRNLRRGSSYDLLHPDRFMVRVNTELLETAIGKHLTLFMGIIDTVARTLTYSLGAHFPMPILTQGGQSFYLEGKGPPLGLFESAQYPLYTIRLESGFSIILCSDGLLEVINAKSIADKEDALLESVKQAGHTIKELERAFGLRWISELPDDVAIVSIAENMV